MPTFLKVYISIIIAYILFQVSYNFVSDLTTDIVAVIIILLISYLVAFLLEFPLKKIINFDISNYSGKNKFFYVLRKSLFFLVLNIIIVILMFLNNKILGINSGHLLEALKEFLPLLLYILLGYFMLMPALVYAPNQWSRIILFIIFLAIVTFVCYKATELSCIGKGGYCSLGFIIYISIAYIAYLLLFYPIFHILGKIDKRNSLQH